MKRRKEIVQSQGFDPMTYGLPLYHCSTAAYTNFYVTDGNIMYPTDASRFLLSCVIQHYAPVVGWGGGGTDA
jgi:hypothetical protein